MAQTSILVNRTTLLIAMALAVWVTAYNASAQDLSVSPQPVLPFPITFPCGAVDCVEGCPDPADNCRCKPCGDLQFDTCTPQCGSPTCCIGRDALIFAKSSYIMTPLGAMREALRVPVDSLSNIRSAVNLDCTVTCFPCAGLDGESTMCYGIVCTF